MIIGTFLPSKPIDMLRMAYPHPVLSLLFKPDLTDEEINTFATALMKPGTMPPSFLGEDIRRSDTRLRAILGEAINKVHSTDGFCRQLSALILSLN
jgi:hypothetical protein